MKLKLQFCFQTVMKNRSDDIQTSECKLNSDKILNNHANDYFPDFLLSEESSREIANNWISFALSGFQGTSNDRKQNFVGFLYHLFRVRWYFEHVAGTGASYVDQRFFQNRIIPGCQFIAHSFKMIHDFEIEPGSTIKCAHLKLYHIIANC